MFSIVGLINVLSNLTIRAYDDEVVISGESNYRIFNVKSGNTLKLFNITLINGNVTDGGAIYLDSNSTLELTSCVVRNNKAVNGGAIYASNSTKVDLKYNQFNNNSADNGLAIYNAGSSIINGDYNWWGQNQGPSRNNIVYGNIVASKWLIVDLNTTKTYLKSDSTDTITIRLLLNDNSSFEEFTPDLKLTFNFENSTDDNYLSMFDNYTLEYVVGGATGDINGSAVIDDETLNFSYKYVPTLDTIYVSVDGSDINGDGSESNPFATIEHGLIYDAAVVGCTMDREVLYERINQRVLKMMEEGLEEEVKGLIDQGVNFNDQSMQAIGYKEWKNYLEANQSKEEKAR